MYFAAFGTHSYHWPEQGEDCLFLSFDICVVLCRVVLCLCDGSSCCMELGFVFVYLFVCPAGASRGVPVPRLIETSRPRRGWTPRAWLNFKKKCLESHQHAVSQCELASFLWLTVSNPHLDAVLPLTHQLTLQTVVLYR